MNPPCILIIEDNPIAQRMVRAPLELEGYRVIMAENGKAALDLMPQAPDLILQDLVLPDMDGFELVRQLRALPTGRAIPILAFSGFLSKIEQARSLEVGFTDYLFKPVESSRLLQTIRTYLQPIPVGSPRPGRGRRVLVVNDDPGQLKLMQHHLEQLDFRVIAVESGTEALVQARLSRPDAVVSDVLMPGMDGFRLCLAIRQDPELAQVPVVLTSAAYTEDEDRELARAVGASELARSTPDGRELIEALLASLDQPPPAAQRVEPGEEYTHRLIRQLERQVALNASLTERLALRETELAILGGFAESLKEATSIDSVVGELLGRCLNAAGISKGAAYLADAGGRPLLRAQIGFPPSSYAALTEFFGHGELLADVMQRHEPIAKPSPQAPKAELLATMGATSILIVPLLSDETAVGALVMASEGRTLGSDWLPFAKVVGNQVGQAVALAGAIARLRESEEKLAGIVSTMAEGLMITDRDGRFVFANAAAGKILGLLASQIAGRKCTDPALKITWADNGPLAPASHPCLLVVRNEKPMFDVELAVERPDASRVTLSINCAPLRETSGAVTGAVTTLHDITGRKQAEQMLARQAERLARINTELDQFNYAASHDLQEPLRTVTSYLQLLERRYQGKLDADADRFIAFAVDASKRMQRLITDLLAYNRLTRSPNNFQKIDCEAVFHHSVANLQASIQEGAAEITHDPLPRLVGDALQLTQLFQNLIGNAIKFHGESPPQIHISSKQKDQEWIFSVRDNGIGIDPQFSERIFEVFQRLHGKQQYPGSGIGLALCKQIIENHGGRIWVESEPGNGSIFYFAIPSDRLAETAVSQPPVPSTAG